jgi:hypothetical protein
MPLQPASGARETSWFDALGEHRSRLSGRA